MARTTHYLNLESKLILKKKFFSQAKNLKGVLPLIGLTMLEKIHYRLNIPNQKNMKSKML